MDFYSKSETKDGNQNEQDNTFITTVLNMKRNLGYLSVILEGHFVCGVSCICLKISFVDSD